MSCHHRRTQGKPLWKNPQGTQLGGREASVLLGHTGCLEKATSQDRERKLADSLSKNTIEHRFEVNGSHDSIGMQEGKAPREALKFLNFSRPLLTTCSVQSPDVLRLGSVFLQKPGRQLARRNLPEKELSTSVWILTLHAGRSGPAGTPRGLVPAKLHPSLSK